MGPQLEEVRALKRAVDARYDARRAALPIESRSEALELEIGKLEKRVSKWSEERDAAQLKVEALDVQILDGGERLAELREQLRLAHLESNAEAEQEDGIGGGGGRGRHSRSASANSSRSHSTARSAHVAAIEQAVASMATQMQMITACLARSGMMEAPVQQVQAAQYQMYTDSAFDSGQGGVEREYDGSWG